MVAVIIVMVLVGLTCLWDRLMRVWGWMQDLLRRRQQSLPASDGGYHMMADLGG